MVQIAVALRSAVIHITGFPAIKLMLWRDYSFRDRKTDSKPQEKEKGRVDIR